MSVPIFYDIVVSIVMLFLSLIPIWPYGYYMLLRLVVCGTGIYVAIKSKESNRRGWMWGMGFIALLFNPIIPLHFSREFWIIVDLVVAGIFGKFLLDSKKQK